MYLSEIIVYPIKSLSGISLETSLIEERGLRFDRRWMLVDKDNNFLTQRELPQMAAIKVGLNAVSLSVSYNSESLEIPFEFSAERFKEVRIWNSCVPAKFYSREINMWFSDILQTECRLVFMSEESKREVNPVYAVHKNQDLVSFADGYPFLLIGQSSLDELNERLETPLPMNRFRPNFVISQTEPFAEDNWKKIEIGDNVFHIVKPCARCVLTTVDQKTGRKEGNEPLRTLASYRTREGKVLFGQNLIAEKASGQIKVGDKVRVLEEKRQL